MSFFSVCLHRQECVNVFWNVPYFILVFNVRIFIDSCHICMQVCANWTFLQVHTTLYANDSLTFSAGDVFLGLISWSASLIDGIYYLDLCCIKGFHPKKRYFFFPVVCNSLFPGQRGCSQFSFSQSLPSEPITGIECFWLLAVRSRSTYK